MPRINDGTDDDSTDSGARRAARRAADEIRRLGGATQDVEDPEVTDTSSDDSGGSGSSTSSPSSTPNVSDTPDDLNAGRRATDTSSGSSSSSSGSTSNNDSTSSSSSSSSTASVTDTPDDINAGRRATRGGSSGGGGGESSSSGTSTDSSTPSITDTPDDINSGRRSSGSSSSGGGSSSGSSSSGGGSSSGSSSSGSSGGSDEESPVEQVRGTVESNTSNQGLESEGSGRTSEAARELEQTVINQTEGIDSADEVRVVRDGDKIRAELTSQGDRSMQDVQEDQVAQQVIESTEGIDERSEVEVIQRGDSFEAQLTGEGEQARQDAVEQNQRDAIAEMGTTGRSLLARQAAQEAGVTRSDVDVDVQESSVEVGLSESGVERAAQRQQAAFASDVRTNQFAREQLREEFAGESEDLDSSDVDLDVTREGVEVGLTEGGESRQAVARAAENSEFSRDELTATVNEDGETRVQLSEEALVERAVSQNDDVSQDDLRVVEREFDGASERRSGSTERVIALTDEAERDRFRDRLKNENPNAESIKISREDGDLQATVTSEGGVDRAVRMGENFVANPVSSVAGGTMDIVDASVTETQELGEAGFDAATNPIRTVGSVGDDLVAAGEREINEITAGVESGIETVGSAAENPVNTSIDIGESLAEGAVETGSGVASFANEVGSRTDGIASSAAVAPLVTGASAAAVAEPTPFGEAAVGAAALLGTGAIAASVAGDDIARATNDATQNEFVTDESELPVQAPSEAVSELNVPESSQPEIGVGRVRPESELGVEESDPVSELDIPAGATGASRGTGVGISLNQVQIGREELEERDDPRTIDEEDISTPFEEPDQAPPSTRERIRRDDLFTPTREFPTGESAVVGRTVTSGDATSNASEPSVDVGDDLGVGQGAGQPGQGTVPGVNENTEVGNVTAAQNAQRPAVRFNPDALGQLDTEATAQLQLSAVTSSLAQTGVTDAFTRPTSETVAPEFATEPGTAFGSGSGSSRGGRRPRLPSGLDLDNGFSDSETSAAEGLFNTGFMDFDTDDVF